ncbi:NUDIX domain-containing protein [Corynebacterium sp. CCM 9185]|uniref:NUDIX domain-containing protein n=1 Tax=Corynebacterium marambiense TaxID=2765364 RepID=A0ABS0VXN1_9CORY|nr:NUDIX domain-containing protein [Corynebacterium marambiense]MBI9000102.1 NUDIX domain-containing protein [Corynebacterium marambiense]MCK7663456.1 NUDIX domain-containing protein [Corynebacterium marambiense]
MTVIRIAAVVLRNSDGEVLSVRKCGTDAFMMPGGKIEPRETARGAAVREISEELGLDLEPGALTFLGRFSARAANETGCSVDCDVFIHHDPLRRVPDVRAEIAEARFFPVGSTAPSLAPLSREVVFPVLADISR